MNGTHDPRRWTLDRPGLARAWRGTRFERDIDALTVAIEGLGASLLHGDLPRWQAALAALPTGSSPWLDAGGAVVTAGVARDTRDGDSAAVIATSTPTAAADAVAATSMARESATYPADDAEATRTALMQLRPWRKGPFRLHGMEIDTEWRSDLKWDRLAPHLAPLAGRRVLDVGSGSGYHLWRLHAAGAAAVLGIEPMLLYQCQFDALARCAPDKPVRQLPLRLEQLPDSLQVDTVFSMGVLYHARNPAAHLDRLRRTLQPGGQCVLESLVLDCEDDRSLRIDDRYAGMRNIRELPSLGRIQRWFEEAGFEAVRRVSVERTGTHEQRRTRWSTGHSLADSLDPENPGLTIEGYPAPCRIILIGAT